MKARSNCKVLLIKKLTQEQGITIFAESENNEQYIYDWISEVEVSRLGSLGESLRMIIKISVSCHSMVSVLGYIDTLLGN